MAEEQIEEIRGDVQALLEDCVENIFITMQTVMKVKSGDVSPLVTLDLCCKEEELAKIIAEILVMQKEINR